MKTKEIIEKIDFAKLHEEIVLNPWGVGGQVWIMFDGEKIEFRTESQSTWTNSDSFVATLKSPCLSDVEDAYFDGWGKYDYGNRVFKTDDDRELTKEEAIIECIQEGEWSEYYEQLTDQIREQIEDKT